MSEPNNETPQAKTAWQAFTMQEVLSQLETSLSGLSQQEAEERLGRYGRNQLEKKRDHAWGKLFLAQFTDILAQILLVAAGLSLIFGEMRDAIIIVVIVLVNALVGFVQEFKAEKILEQMERFTSDKAYVIRSGEKHQIDARDLVPGDVVFVDAGSRMPADGYVVESYACRVDGFIFSGESKAEQRMPKVMAADVPLADIENMIFMGESVVSGEAKLVVVETGTRTELGQLAQMAFAVKPDPTPLQKKMKVLGRWVAIVSLIIAAIVIGIGQYLHVSLYDNFLLALALAVSVVPEGLPAAISVALALGMKRLLKRHVLAKRLNAVETLGSVTTICTDKTGTITRNELMVTQVSVGDRVYTVSGEGYRPRGEFFLDGQLVNAHSIPNGELLFRIATLCNDASLVEERGAFAILGDPTEGALIVAARKYNIDPKFFTAGEKQISEIPFASERMRMSVLYGCDGRIASYVKGSPDVLLELATERLDASGAVITLTEEEKGRIKAEYNGFSERALRVLAFAYRDMTDVASVHYPEEMERGLVWVGMMAMIDPPRADVAQAVFECRRLGLRTIMITGDYAITAEAIATAVGLIDPLRPHAVLSGRELTTMTDDRIFDSISGKDAVFARIAPDQKLRIAGLLQARGEVIAMTGDGVNDAPALKKADIGVAMGIIGTDVSKEAAAMVLLDDNFASIVAGVKEGRTIYANLRKFVHYVFASNVSELFTVVLGFILQIPAPISAVQILAIDLGTDVFPSFALGLEPAEPRRGDGIDLGKKNIIEGSGIRRLIIMGFIMAVGAVIAFLWSLTRHGWHFGGTLDFESLMYLQAATATYVVLAVSQLANLVQARSETLHPSELGWTKNLSVWGAAGLSLFILWCFMHLTFFQIYLRMRPIEWQDWLVVAVTTLAVYGYETWRKNRLRRSSISPVA